MEKAAPSIMLQTKTQAFNKYSVQMLHHITSHSLHSTCISGGCLTAATKVRHLKTAVPDNLHPRAFKELAEELDGPLMLILNKSWSTGEIPEDW